MPEDFHFLALIVIPIILLAIWATYMLATRKTKSKRSVGREDSTEPKELKGPEQHKRRQIP